MIKRHREGRFHALTLHEGVFDGGPHDEEQSDPDNDRNEQVAAEVEGRVAHVGRTNLGSRFILRLNGHDISPTGVQ